MRSSSKPKLMEGRESAMEGAWAEVRGGRRESVGSKVEFMIAVCGLVAMYLYI